ncbi:MAG: DNA polymerase III subunit gamma/tau [Firmicutes bacterium]|nr:DNA polymerase III subunit gamma/tau [Bacillota bacterium]MDY5676366.1 DNA polymerase III subunit gamma/tau [Eubacteriales bacterium]
MSYTALYRKYRSQSFDEIVGQKHIITSLTNQIKNNQVGHAYLFTGTRGTGKTSIAKIFAKAINCPHSHNGNPCNKCEICESITSGSNVDILEIDAASNNRVDEIRELREKVKYPPVTCKYKVYIIDEVHMLTDSAFNALLKTLEEPPAYVVFILATTEVQKLPATILSRCLRFDFKLLTDEELEKHLKYVFEDSGIKYEKEALTLLAKLGNGSVRDTLSIADMCVAYSNKNVTYSSVIEAVGMTDRQTLKLISECLLAGDQGRLLSAINEVACAGKNLTQLAKDLVGYIRDILIVKTCKDYKDILKLSSDNISDLEALSKIATSEKLIEILTKLSSLDNDFRYSTSPRNLLEITLVSLCNFEMTELNDLKMQVKLLEKKIK